MKYAVIIRYNGRIGGRAVLADTFNAESVVEALELASAAAVRSKAGGGDIFVTGICVDELKP
jgi:hypothetical protein